MSVECQKLTYVPSPKLVRHATDTRQQKTVLKLTVVYTVSTLVMVNGFSMAIADSCHVLCPKY